MAFDAEVTRAIRAVAHEHSIDPAALLAIAEVESGGRPYTTIDGRPMPLILFEYHVFYRNLPLHLRKPAVAAGLARRRWGELPYKRTQKARYALLNRARALDEQAAFAACSWGVGQVLGENAVWLGYGTPADLAEQAMSGVAGQVRLMVRFIRKRGLMEVLDRRDWSKFALRYNGPGQVAKYARMMERAYRRHDRDEPAPILRAGAKGLAVAELQRSLRWLGYPLVIDGDFGPATRRAVVGFQRDEGLSADGVAGPLTMARIAALSSGTTQTCARGAA